MEQRTESVTNSHTLTAVEWLALRYHHRQGYLSQDDIAEAKEMEKEQILNADLNATIRTAKGVNADVSVKRVKELAEKYYNETYNK
jgi:hypothetical protein